MPSQQDLDQGGIERHYARQWLGPSVGWLLVPVTSIVNITTAGTTNILLGTNLVLVNVAALVIVQLPSAKQSPAGAQALPGTFVGNPITVLDLGGNAAVNNITILPFGAELIDGLANIVIRSAFGAFTLNPNRTGGGYTLTQQ